MSNYEEIAIKDSQNLRTIQLASNRELRVAESERVAGGSFEGSVIDTNFWLSTTSNGSSNSQSFAEFSSSSGTTSGSLSLLQSSRVARYKSGNQNVLGCSMLLSSGVVGNTRRFGLMDTNRNNGFFFYLSDTTFGIGSIKNGTPNLVPSGSFNGNDGSSYVLDTNYHTYEIIYGLTAIDFYIDGILVHKMRGTTGSLSGTMLLRITIENHNASSTSQTAYICSTMMAVQCLSASPTQPISAVIETNGTFVLKIGNGKLKRILNLDNVGVVNVYDNTAGSGVKLLPTMDCARAVGTIDCDVTFDNGLTIVSTNTPKLLVVYE
jgi:hypothetical protein